jgi:dTMP kinase
MGNQNGRFIVLEGADGCGKSTQAERLVASLTALGTDVVHVREPGSTTVGEGVRALLLDRATGALSPRTETLLYLAARAQLVAEVIRPALQAGKTVVSERWTLSTEVYQGLAGDLGLEAVQRAAPLAEDGVQPNLVIVLDVGLGEGLARLTGEPDRMEAKGAAFHERVVEGYRRLAAEREHHVCVSPGPPDVVAALVLASLQAFADDERD